MTALPGERKPGSAARVVLLLSAAAFINYVDRGTLATAGPLIRDEFGLSNTQLGVLLSAFFWSYAPSQLPAGWLAERLDARRVLAAGLALWGIATLLAGFATGFLMLLLLRLLLGVGESVMYPASFKVLAVEAQEAARGRACGFLASGLHLGAAFGVFAGALAMARFGWRVFFIGAGMASLLWLWPWLRTPRIERSAHELTSVTGPPTLTLLARPELWLGCLGHFCAAYSLYLVISWLPTYLVQAQGFSMAMVAPLGATVYLLAALCGVLTGWLSDRRIAAGADGNRVRKTVMLTAFLGLAVGFTICALAGRWGSVVGMAECGVSLGIATAGIYIYVQSLAGPGAAARWMAVQNFCGNIAGISAPLVTGFVADRTGGFAAAFLLAAALAVVGLLAVCVLLRRIEPVDWARAAQSPAARLRG